MGEKEKKGNEAVGNLDFRKIVYFDGETIDNSLQSSMVVHTQMLLKRLG